MITGTSTHNQQMERLWHKSAAILYYKQEHMSRPKGGEGASNYVSDVLGKVH